MSRCWIAQTFKQLQAENTANADLTHRTVSDLRVDYQKQRVKKLKKPATYNDRAPYRAAV